MGKPPAARYGPADWSSCDAALRRRGAMLVWADRELDWSVPHEGRPGPPPVFRDAAIRFCLSTEVLFRLGACHSMSLSSQIDSDPRRFGDPLRDFPFALRQLAASGLLIPSVPTYPIRHAHPSVAEFCNDAGPVVARK